MGEKDEAGKEYRNTEETQYKRRTEGKRNISGMRKLGIRGGRGSIWSNERGCDMNSGHEVLNRWMERMRNVGM